MSALQLNVVIIGAGLGGLSAAICLSRKGHIVTVLERSEGPSEYGAGIQLSPNATRLLDAWGLTSDFQKYAHIPTSSVARRYSTNTIIGINPQNPEASEVYRYP